jgi:ribosomal protein S12 methylthiotransferase accessory factor
MQELMSKDFNIVPIARQTRANFRLIPQELELAWIQGYRLVDGSTIYAPAELVGLDLNASSPWRHDLFRMTSLGLGAGLDLEHATLQAIEELIEDDAFFGLPFSNQNIGSFKPLCLAKDENEPLQKLLDHLSDLGFSVRFADGGSILNYPAVACVLSENEGENGPPRSFGGYGSKSDAGKAALAALLEAIQSRLTFIAGGRDDLFESEYSGSLKKVDNNWFMPVTFTAPCGDQPSVASLQRAVECIAASTKGSIYVFPLTPADHPYAVVRVLADDMLSRAIPKNHIHGPRAGERLFQSWGLP